MEIFQPSKGFQLFPPSSPYVSRLSEFGPIYHRAEDLVLALRVTRDHTNMHAMAHGGLLATMVDCALGNAVVTRLGVFVVTVQMSISYLQAVRENAWLEAHCRIDRAGRRLIYGTCTLKVGDVDVLQATSVFAVRTGPEGKFVGR